MPSNDEIFEAVASIESPLLVGRTLGSLGLVKSAEKKLGKVKVDLLLPNSNPPAILNERLQQALEPYGRGADVTVEAHVEIPARHALLDRQMCVTAHRYGHLPQSYRQCW